MSSRLSSKAVALLAAMLCLSPLSSPSAQEGPIATAPAQPAAGPLPAAGPAPATPQPARPRLTPRPAAPAAAVTIAPPQLNYSPGNPIFPADLEAFVDGAVRDAMASEHISGVTISVVQNGQVILKKGYGAAGQDPIRPVNPDTTLFRIGSISKTYTWILAMRELESGRMRLEAPINLYLPQKVQVRDQGFKKQVTLRDLMTHTPGFEDRALGQLFERDPARVRSLENYLRQERPARVRDPGTLPSYSNYGAALAGEAVSYVNGKPYEQLVEDVILKPMGLTHTTFREPRPARDGLPAPMSAALAGDRADPLSWTGSGYVKEPYEYIGQIAPAGAASSTAGDMARYMLLLLNGGTLDGVTVFGPATAKDMRTTLSRPAPEATGWNYGFQDIALPGGVRGFGHGGATLSFYSNMVVAPDLGLGIFISTNTDTGRPLTDRLPKAIVARFFGAGWTLPQPGSQALKDNRAAYAGTFISTRRAYHGLERLVSGINSLVKIDVTSAGYLAIDAGDGAKLYAATEKPAVFRALGGPETVVAEMKDGKAVRYFSASGTSAFERTGFIQSMSLLAILAALAIAASIATLVGLFLRGRRDFRQSQSQSRGNMIQTTQSVLWLLSTTCFLIWLSGTGDVPRLLYGWPGGWMLTASACALVASLLAVVVLLLLPLVWQGGRRVDSWTLGRKLRFTATTLIFAAFAALLTYWGAVVPWS